MNKLFMLLSLILVIFPPLSVAAKDSIIIKQGMEAPVFNVKQLNGISFTLNSNKPAIIWFFAPWCGYTGKVYPSMSKDCIEATSRLKLAYQTYGEQFDWIGISTHLGSSHKDAGTYRVKHGIPFAVAIDKIQGVFMQYGVMYSPTVIIVDKGKVRYRAKASLNKLEETIEILSRQSN